MHELASIYMAWLQVKKVPIKKKKFKKKKYLCMCAFMNAYV